MAFDNAIKATLDLVNLEETLIVVTADHGHTMTMSGYQSRGINVLGNSLSNLNPLEFSRKSYFISANCE